MIQGDFKDAAEKAFRKAIFLRKNVVMYENPQSIKEDAMTGILEALVLEGDFKRAEKKAERCLSENGSDEMKIAVLATYLRTGFFDKEETFFESRGTDDQELIGPRKL